jgi:hypothetical protein
MARVVGRYCPDLSRLARHTVHPLVPYGALADALMVLRLRDVMPAIYVRRRKRAERAWRLELAAERAAKGAAA